MAVPIIEAGVPKKDLINTLKYLAGHELFFLGLSMAAAKATADAIADTHA